MAVLDLVPRYDSRVGPGFVPWSLWKEGRGGVGVWSGRWLGIYEITAPPDLHLVVTVVCSVTVQ